MSEITAADRRKAWWRRRFWDLLIILLVLFIADSLFWGRDAGLADGTRAPDESVRPLGGGHPIRLAKRDGRPLLLLFWATWCPACRDELPAIDRVARRYAGSGLQTLAVTDEIGVASQVTQFLLDRGLTVPVGLEQGQVRAAYKVGTIPTVYLIDARGTIVWSRVGAVSADHLHPRFGPRHLRGGAHLRQPLPAGKSTMTFARFPSHASAVAGSFEPAATSASRDPWFRRDS